MKTIYKTGNGQTAELEVSTAVAELLAGFDREDKNAARKERQRKETSLDAMYEETGFEPTDTSIDIETDYIAQEEKAALLAAVSELSEKQRRLVALYYYEEKTLREIGGILGVHFSCVQRQLETVHKKLKNLLEKKF